MKAHTTKKHAKKPATHGIIGVTLIAAVAVIAAGIGIYAYSQQGKPTETNTPPPVEEPGKTLLTVHLGSQAYTYTLKDLKALANVTGQGGSITPEGVVTGPNTYTGVPISVLFTTLPALPGNRTLRATASDGHTHNYTTDTVSGHVIAYASNGEEIGPGTLTMIIAYKENGAYLDDTNGPLCIAFVYSSPIITSASLWMSQLSDLQIL